MTSIISVLAAEGFNDRIFGLDPQLLADTAIAMLSMFLVFLLLSYLLFNPARNMLKKRRDKIGEDMDMAVKEKEDAIRFKQEYDAKLKQANTEIEDILREKIY